MAFPDQYGSNFFGNVANMYPQRPDGGHCFECRATDLYTIDCPLYAQPSYQAENKGNRFTFESTLGSSQQNSQLVGNSSHRGASSYDEHKAITDGIVAKLSALVQLVAEGQTTTTEVFAAHNERIQVLEQAKSSSDETIKDQAKRIKSLEETVSILQTRLKNKQHEHMTQYEAMSRRVKQLIIEVPHLRDQIHRVDALLSQVQQEHVHHVNSGVLDSDEEEGYVIQPGCRDQCVDGPSSEEEVTPTNTTVHDATSNKEEPAEFLIEDLRAFRESVSQSFMDDELKESILKHYDGLISSTTDELKIDDEEYARVTVENLPSLSIIFSKIDKEIGCKELNRASTSSKHEETSENEEEPCMSYATSSTNMDDQVEFPSTVV